MLSMAPCRGPSTITREWAGQGGEILARFHVPQVQDTIRPAGGQYLAVRAEETAVPLEAARVDRPQPLCGELVELHLGELPPDGHDLGG
jgi:hypothetical protein